MNKLFKLIILFCLVFSQSKMINAQDQHVFGHQQVITKGRIWDVAFEDLNKDGFSDMAIADWFKPPTIIYNDRNGNFEGFESLSSHEASDSSYRAHGAGINDFNGDGNPDIFAVFNGLNNLVYLSNGREFILTDTINTQNSDGLNVSLGDIDNDKDIDAFITNYRQPTILWINNGEGMFTKSDFELGSASMFNTTLGDINNDGSLDMVCSIYRKVIVWLNNGDGTFEKNIQSYVNEKGYGIAKLADLDNDDDLDIIFSNNELGTSILLNNGEGKFYETEVKLSDCTHLALGDVDLNGQIDVICGNTIWLNKGNLQFNKYEAFEMEGRILGLWLNDIDNDNDLDLFYSSSIPQKGLVLLKNKTKAN